LFENNGRWGSIALFCYYVGNIAGGIAGITRKSTAENPIGGADFLIM